MSLLPISLTSDIAQYINLSKDTNATQKLTFTVNDAGTTTLKSTPVASLLLPSATQWAEDTPCGLASENTGILLAAADNTQFTRNFAWSAPRKFKLEKLVANIALAMRASANAGNDCNFDTFTLTIAERKQSGESISIVNTGTRATGHTTLTGAGVQVFIIEEPFRWNRVIEDSSIILVTVTMACTLGTATTQQGIVPAFPYYNPNATKWVSQSGVYLEGSSII